ncbi:hypothetical protein EI94DRAFT_1706557 [Lactarius quietus]|nr:hypothetical protein EI94DRAFT_1706557 [Lactarius quietus]
MKMLGVDLQSAPDVSCPALRAGSKCTVSGSTPIPCGSTAAPPPALPVTPETPTQSPLDERLTAALAATVQKALNPVLDQMSVIEKALPKPLTRANPPRAITTKIRPAEPITQPRAPKPDDNFIEIMSGKSRKARVRKKKAQAATSLTTNMPPRAATPPAPPLRQINLNPFSYTVATTNLAASPPTATSPNPPNPLLTEVTVL